MLKSITENYWWRVRYAFRVGERLLWLLTSDDIRRETRDEQVAGMWPKDSERIVCCLRIQRVE